MVTIVGKDGEVTPGDDQDIDGTSLDDSFDSESAESPGDDSYLRAMQDKGSVIPLAKTAPMHFFMVLFCFVT